MDFIELDRSFIPLKTDQEPTLDWGPYWGRLLGDWLNWDELLKHRRVVLLAEALSGKTEEYKYQAKQLSELGKPAFFVRIEDLADDGFEKAIDPEVIESFLNWKNDICSEAWFFLDSVDEARLNRKDFDKALRKFLAELGIANLGRSFIYISCRVSDWRGKADRVSFNKWLPYSATIKETEKDVDPDEALLAPIFKQFESVQVHPKPQKPNPSDLLVVQLAPLSFDQKKLFAEKTGITNINAFMGEIENMGLSAMTERPGDLVELVSYWKENSRFDSLAEMTEYCITKKLREESPHRLDSSILSLEKVRQGVERLATALTLGKSFNLKAPAQEPDSNLAAGAIDPNEVLSEWSDGELTVLLHRGIFSPATYGRLRFHHRSTQEYLTATWLDRLLNNNCPLTEVWQLLFQECYGVETVAPSLRPVAAWLSIRHPVIRDEVIRREPLILIQYGDPKSLSIESRCKLLLAYAELHLKGQINPQMLEHRSIWMFSEKALAGAIHQAWSINSRTDFRGELLRFILEANISDCADLARITALDESQDSFSRIIAAQALSLCQDKIGLRQLASQVKSYPEKLSARLAPELALVLFPAYLSTIELLDLIDRSKPAQPYSSVGFSRQLNALHKAAPTRTDQKIFANGVAKLCLKPPYADEDLIISNRHVELSSGLASLVEAELFLRSIGDVDPELLYLLMAVGRVREIHNSEEKYNRILLRIKKDKALTRALFWADVQSHEMGNSKEPPIRIWQINSFSGRKLWQLDITDLDWLIQDCRIKAEISEKQLVFNGIWMVLFHADQIQENISLLDSIASGNETLIGDLSGYLNPPKGELSNENKAYSRRKKLEQEMEKQYWRDFCNNLKNDPTILSDTANLQSWKDGLWRLHELTRWLRYEFRQDSDNASRHWRTLEKAFGLEVSKHYCLGMKKAWRYIKPERPVYQSSGTFTVKYTSSLAIQSLYLDIAEDSDWESTLSDTQVAQATQHACYTGNGFSEWFEILVKTRPELTLPVINASVVTEFRSKDFRLALLHYVSNQESAAQQVVENKIFELLRKAEPANDSVLSQCLLILAKSEALTANAKTLSSLLMRRIRQHLDAKTENRALLCFALYLRINPEHGIDWLESMLIQHIEETPQDWNLRCERWLGYLFGENKWGVVGAKYSCLSVHSLKKLYRLAYIHIPNHENPDDDGGSRVINPAEDARRNILHALLSRPGSDAHQAILELASDPIFADSAKRFKELAHGKAEDDSEISPWKACEVADFEKHHIKPIKTGSDLLRVIVGVLDDIKESPYRDDASSQNLLALATEENQVQTWLAEQLSLRSRGRYAVSRETEIADKNMPDIIITATSAPIQLAIEIKHVNKGWTVKELENSLKHQLAENYLRPKYRRHGIFFITQHKQRVWRKDRATLQFSDLQTHLSNLAHSIITNTTGTVELRVFGLNVAV